VRQIRYEERRARIMRKRDKLHGSRARESSKKIREKQRNFVRTRIWKVVAEIVRLAREYRAVIAVEDLKDMGFPFLGSHF
jgi:transposase